MAVSTQRELGHMQQAVESGIARRPQAVAAGLDTDRRDGLWASASTDVSRLGGAIAAHVRQAWSSQTAEVQASAA